MIRQATRKDAKAITPLLLMAMEDIIYQFIGETNHEKAAQFICGFVNEIDNQYSYQNCWVLEKDNEIIAAANVYDGALLQQLRAPVAKKVREVLLRDFNPEDETADGEFYIDCIAVSTKYRGQGLGSKILEFLIEKYVSEQQKVLGLLVDKDNPSAEKLYLKLGFKHVGEKTLVGKQLKHLQFS